MWRLFVHIIDKHKRYLYTGNRRLQIEILIEKRRETIDSYIKIRRINDYRRKY